ncbi:hypothetical protein LNQ03_27100 [Klebsiella pneumoniae subsp. pneumoniae]|nr:hypothetical protein [Klebsiella pneumoniae subsp. pneumoniae]
MNTGWWIICPVASTRRSTAARRLLSSVERWPRITSGGETPAVGDGDPTLAGQRMAGCRSPATSLLAKRSWRSVFGAISPEQGQLFVGNSLVVRLDRRALAQLPAGYPVYSNRGASGIDGLDRHCGRRAARQRPDRRWPSLAISPRSTISTRWPCCARRRRRWC